MKKVLLVLLVSISFSAFSQKQVQVWNTEEKTVIHGSEKNTGADESTFSFDADYQHFNLNERKFDITIPTEKDGVFTFYSTDKAYIFSLNLRLSNLMVAFSIGSEVYVVSYKIKD